MLKTITKDTILADVLSCPGSEEILMKHKLPCLTCPLSAFEIKELKIGQVCEFYGIDAKRVIEELNKHLKRNELGRKRKKA